MKTVIIYGSKNGTTAKCANILKDKLNSDIIDLKNKKNYDLEKYDLIIIGTPIYISKPIKIVRKFCQKYNNILSNKKIAFFLCGSGKEEEVINNLKKNISSSLTSKAIISHFGGEILVENARFLRKIILQKMLEETKTTPSINNLEIDKFVERISEN